MSISRLQSTTTYPYSPTTITCSAGSLVIVFMATNIGNTGPVPTVSDNNGGAYTVKAGYGNGAAFVTGWIGYAYNHNPGSTQITVSGAPWVNDVGISIHEYSGIQTGSDPFDGISGSFSSGANPTSGTVNTTGTNDLIVGMLADETSTESPSSYGTLTKVEESTGHYHTTGDQLNVVAGSYSFSPTRGAGVDTVIIVAAFKGATSSAQTLSYKQSLTVSDTPRNGWCSSYSGPPTNFYTYYCDGSSGGTWTMTETSPFTTNGILIYTIVPGANVAWNGGPWTVRLNVNSANANLTWDFLVVCWINSSYSTFSTIVSQYGVNSGNGYSLGSTGVIVETTPSGTAIAAPTATDRALVYLSFSGASAGAQSAIINNNVFIDTPFTTTAGGPVGVFPKPYAYWETNRSLTAIPGRLR